MSGATVQPALWRPKTMQNGCPTRVDEDPEPCLRLTWRTSGAKRPELLLGLIRVIHANVEMQLLGMRWIRPARRDPFGDPLESQLTKTRL